MEQPQAWQFGDFTLLPTQRLLLDGDAPVRVGGRALDLLIALVEAAGTVVGRDELMASVWKKVVVEEGSLRVHIAALRRALGDGGDARRYIVNVPGQGYSFVGDVSPSAPASVTGTWPKLDVGRTHLPPLLVNVVGRDDAIQEVCSMVVKQRLVTVVGAGGVGKTTVALAAAAQLAAHYRDGARFVDLAPLTDAHQVAKAWASAIGDSSMSVSDERDLGALLADRHMLIVLDNCEHVVQAAATVAEAVLASAPGVHVLATSREPIRATAEWIFRLASLELPPASARLTAQQATAFAAVQLFTQRTAATFPGFTFTDADVPDVTEICWRLDGIPLAIELAAGRVAQLGLRGLSAGLEDRFAVLTKGLRTALPRQQTLRAAIDWSYELLSEDQKAVLRRLSIFAGAFTYDSAVAICEDDLSADVCDAFDELVLKSLIAVDASTDIARYRLLEMTRAYAFEKLKGADELVAASRSHARHVCSVFERLEAESPLERLGDAGHARWIDDIQLAVQASFFTLSDPDLGTRLLAATASVWFQRSLMDEYRTRAEMALEKAADLGEQRDATLMRLWHSLGLCYWHIRGTGPEVVRAFRRTYDLARRLRNVYFERLALWGLCAESCTSGDYAAALGFAREHAALTPLGPDPEAAIQGRHMLQVSLHLMGDQASSQDEATSALSLIRRTGHRRACGEFRLDPHSGTNAFLSRALWIQGRPAQALEAAAEAVQSARSTQHDLTLCFALFGECAVLLWCGRWADLGREADALMELATDRRLSFWKSWAQTYKDAHAYGAEGVVVPQWRSSIVVPHQLEMMATVGDELLDGDALIRAEAGDCPWVAPEVLRAQGEKLLRQGASPQEAEGWFIRSLDLARSSKALSWELRAATSLAGCWLSEDRRLEATALLTVVLERYREGFDTVDVRRAQQMLQRTSTSPRQDSVRRLGAFVPSQIEDQ
jgi:predicted ATPase/DNA-binding winged helix-turn-helix (wHTH) protein